MRNWLRVQFYPNEYLKTVYDYYASHGIAYICTYYNLDFEESSMDKDVLQEGAYELTGDLSGVKWKKINMLQIYDLEAIQPRFTADERGMTKINQLSTFNIPTQYQITPTTFDHIIFDSDVLRISDDEKLNTYQITGFEKSTNTDITFWKIGIKESFILKEALDNQTIDTYTFFDYEKKIYQTNDAILLYNMLNQNDQNKMNKYYSNNSGIIFGF